jgi:putative sporulation protein YtaF
MIESLLLVASICIDSFVASMTYGSDRIKIPISSAIIISIISSFILGISLFFGGFIKDFLPNEFAIILSFLILMILGIYRFFEGILKSFILKNIDLEKSLTIKLFHLKLVLQVYADETKADFDRSKVLTLKESIYLAFALSFDSLAVGFGSSLAMSNYCDIILLSLIVGIFSILSGVYLGKKLVEKTSCLPSWLSGIILMILAGTRLFK